MNTTRSCGCKGYRSCVVCEAEFGISPQDVPDYEDYTVYEYQIDGGNEELESLGFSGIKVIPEFISKKEEDILMEDLDLIEWDKSQSGRRKQNFGPRANFKKRKTKVGNFRGFPKCTKFIQDRFNEVDLLEDYKTVEQCSIEYTPEKGSCIEPHIDDCWIWGERIVQLNLLSKTYLTLVPYSGSENPTKYNLQDVKSYPRVISENMVVHNPFKAKHSSQPFNFSSQPIDTSTDRKILVKVPLPPRSLLIMYGAARYEWEHSIMRKDISDRRLIIAYRELTPPYLPGGELEDVGRNILTQAENFWDKPELPAKQCAA